MRFMERRQDVGLILQIEFAIRRPHLECIWQQKRESGSSDGKGVAKRAFDIAAASAALILLAPLMLLIAALIKYNMGGPVIFKHRRVGVGGTTFGCCNSNHGHGR